MNILSEIVSVKKEEIKKLRVKYKYRHFSDFEFFTKPTLPLHTTLKHGPDIQVIAEIKKASPSAGLIRADYNPVEIAETYAEHGAAAISILTDKTFFRGDIKDLAEVAKLKRIPLIRKDFILDEYQVFESRANGADAVLLISEILSQNQISDLSQATFEHGMEVLLELHGADQIGKINFSQNNLIGINNRNLQDFKVDIKTTLELAAILPPDVSLVSESGFKTRDDFILIKESPVKAVLIGEQLMQSADIGAELQQIKSWSRRAD